MAAHVTTERRYDPFESDPARRRIPVDKDLSHRVYRLLEHFGIPLAERDTIFPIVDRSEAADAVKSLPADVQKEALTLLVAAASADGKIVTEEREYLHTVAEAMGVSLAEIDRRLDDAVKK
jgi:2-hydroxychromene-2-carboxylate isomerase